MQGAGDICNYGCYAMERINSGDAGRLKEHRKPALLPIGAVEVHGSHLPLGTDGFIAQAVAYEVARRVDGIVLPLVPYSFCGTTRKLPGTLSIELDAVRAYVKSVCRAAIEQGLRKILIISVHNGNDLFLPMVASELFMEKSVPVTFVNPFSCLGRGADEQYFGDHDNAYKETALALAALRILGMENSVAVPAVESDVQPGTIAPLLRIRKLGTVGYEHLHRDGHIPPRAGVSVKAGLDFIAAVAEEIVKIVRDLDEYAGIIDNTYSKLQGDVSRGWCYR